MIISIAPERVIGLGAVEQVMLQKLLTVYSNATIKNEQKDRYY